MKKQTTKELWKPVNYTFNGEDLGKIYEVSNKGNIRYIKTKKSPYIDDRGLSQKIKVCVRGKSKNAVLHQMVAFTWGGITQEEFKKGNYDIHHIDGDYRNNAIKNLLIIPHDKHMAIEGNLRAVGAKKRRYTDDDRAKIIELLGKGYSKSAIQKETGISVVTIANIANHIS